MNGSDWAARRPRPAVLHLDSAAAGRQSEGTLAATAAHARLEAETGAYVAAELAAAELDRLRDDVAVLLGVAAEGVAFVESATAALEALLRSWPLPGAATVGVLPVEWGPNLEAFDDRGLGRVVLPADADGHLDLAAFERLLTDSPPTVVHLTQVTSHRGLVQPVAAAADLCRAAGVPLWVDAAQAVGHVDTATGADAVYGTSRKWLTGPRGVGFLGVADAHRDRLRVRRSPTHGTDLPTVAHLESFEAHLAGRVGLAHAVREHLADGADDRAGPPRRGRPDDPGRARRRAGMGRDAGVAERDHRPAGHGRAGRVRRPRPPADRAPHPHHRRRRHPLPRRHAGAAAARQPPRRRHHRRPRTPGGRPAAVSGAPGGASAAGGVRGASSRSPG